MKYLKRKLKVEVVGELFSLSDDSVHDQGRYDVLRDIYRLDGVLSAGFVDEGLSISLTNEINYGNPSIRAILTIFEAFQLAEDRKITGNFAFGEDASPWIYLRAYEVYITP